MVRTPRLNSAVHDRDMIFKKSHHHQTWKATHNFRFPFRQSDHRCHRKPLLRKSFAGIRFLDLLLDRFI